MHLLSLVTTLLLPSVTNSIPTHHVSSFPHPDATENGAWVPLAYITTDEDWGHRETSGSYMLLWGEAARCISLIDTAYDRNISSLGPELGGGCMVHDDPYCQGRWEPEKKLFIKNPGYARLSGVMKNKTDRTNWDKKIRSLSCVFGTAPMPGPNPPPGSGTVGEKVE